MSALGRVGRGIWEDSARTALAAVGSFLVAQLLRTPEAYWATISTIIIIQSMLGAALTILWQRFAGTVLGAVAGASLSTYYFRANLAVFGAGIFQLGLGCAILRLGTAYRFAGVRLAITMLMVRDRPTWVAEHRLVEVSVGIAVGPVVSAIWPEQHSRGKQRLEAS